jgi:radical SAM protein with 4Fe4S-binding SPASM domain
MSLLEKLKDKLRASAINRRFRSSEVVDRNVKGFIGGLTVMPNNICNANCTFCAYQFNEEPKETMSLEVFKQTIDSTFKMGHLGTLVLTPVAGEPLADFGLFDKIDYAKSKGVEKIILTTNGILLLKNEIYRKLIDAELDTIHISSPGLDNDAYKRLYKSPHFRKILEGLEKLCAYKELRGCGVAVKLLLRLDRPLEEALQDEGMKALKPYFDRKTIVLDDVRNNFDNWSGHITKIMLTGNMTLNAPKQKPIPCDRMIHDLAVLPDGKVRVCSCRYYRTNHDELVIGDVTKNEMSEILFNDTHKKLLAEVASGNWPRVCQECSLYEPATVSLKKLMR